MNELIQVIISNAAYYRIKLDDSAVRLYAEDLSDLNLADVKRIYAELRRDPKIKFMPMPSEIRSRLNPTISDDEEGKRISATILGCVTRHGWPNWESAKNEMGEIGWNIIKRLGGWTSFCETLSNENTSSLGAQIRELAIVELKQAQGAQHPIALTYPEATPYNDLRIDHTINGLVDIKRLK